MNRPPQRIQRKRTKGWRLPPNTICVTRPGKWGNPYKVVRDDGDWTCANDGERVSPSFTSREEATRWAVDSFRATLRTVLKQEPGLLEPLRGKNLACWCAPGDPCHADVLLEYANK